MILYTEGNMNPDELRKSIRKSLTDAPEDSGDRSIEKKAVRETSQESPEEDHAALKSKGLSESSSSERPHSQSGKSHPQEVYSWKAPLRAYKRTPAGVLRFYTAIAVLLSIIAFFFREFILIIPIWATMFLVYVLTITPPPIVRNTIMKFGIQTPNHTYSWESLSHFYFIKKFGYHILVVFSRAPYTHPLYLVVPDKKIKDDLTDLLSDYLIYLKEPRKTLSDKMAEWLTSLLPEDPDEEKSSGNKPKTSL